MSRRGLPGASQARRLTAWTSARLAPGWPRGGCTAHAARGAQREAGMTTAEYAVGTLAACAFAALLIAVVRSPEIRAALLGLITNALGMGK